MIFLHFNNPEKVLHSMRNNVLGDLLNIYVKKKRTSFCYVRSNRNVRLSNQLM